MSSFMATDEISRCVRGVRAPMVCDSGGSHPAGKPERTVLPRWLPVRLRRRESPSCSSTEVHQQERSIHRRTSDAVVGRGDVMETFILAPVGGWIVRAFGRNPL